MSKLRSLPAFLLVFIAVELFFHFFFTDFENAVYDLKLVTFAKKVDSNVVLVSIDDYSLEFYRENFNIPWPWPRSFYARMLELLTQSRAVAFDIIFAEQSLYEGEDRIFADAVRESGNVLFPVIFTAESGKGPLISRFALKNPPAMEIQTYSGVRTPIEMLLNSCRGIGAVNQEPEQDGLYRRLRHYFCYRGKTYPSFPLAILSSTDLERDTLQVPLDDDGKVALKFYTKDSFETYNAAAVIQSALQLQKGEEPQLSPALFKDRIVIVGATASGLLDFRPYPLDSKGTGYEIVAHGLENLLRRDFIKPLPAFWTHFALFLTGLLLHMLLLQISSLTKEVGMIFFFLVLLAGSNLALFVAGRQLPLLSFALLFVAIGSYNGYRGYSQSRREKIFVQNLFKNYVSEKLLDRIMDDPGVLQLGGEKVPVTIYFSDLAGFTTLSEKLSAEEVVLLLNRYLERMTTIILAHDGYVDKFEGDAVMAFWGAPLPQPDQRELAARAALLCQKELQNLNREFSENGWPEFSMRIGLNSGAAVAGNIGSERKFEYTLIGDAVNFASRLEGVNKFYGTKIAMGENCARGIPNDLLFRKLDRVKVKGKTEAEEIYELIGKTDDFSALEIKAFRDFETALERYFNGGFESAARIFSRLAGKDAVAGVFLERCRQLLNNPPEEWDGVWVFHEK
ncbi:MAG TPA: adenylate/guanylate cyclase domain-containing protein [Candidatus Aminicenantes bacterium]|nr:adenylate/guanylate cyclase domain-containing protein [Candidatus Aminicenantes bacterium]